LESLTLAHLVEAQSKDVKNHERAIFFLNDKHNQGNLAKAS
ncbi:MAG: DNA-binding transcriptional repressor, partial [Pseudomonadota bacterium]